MNSRRREYCESMSDYRRSQQKRRRVARRRRMVANTALKGAIFGLAFALVASVTMNAVAYMGNNFMAVNGRLYSKNDETVSSAMKVACTRVSIPELELDWMNDYEEPETIAATSLQASAAPEEEIVEEETEPAVEEVEATVQTVSNNNSGYTYTEEDYDYLLMAIVGEAQNCSYTEQLYVGSVVLNRLHHTKAFKYADCIKDVVMADNQYVCFDDGNAYRNPTETNKQVARELLESGSVLPANVVYQSRYVQGSGIYCEIDGTYFCYL